MDPNLIHLDWERTFEALMMIIVLAFILERALAVLFENKLYIMYLDRAGLKEIVAVAVSIAVCVWWKFDAVSMIVLVTETNMPGYIITGAVIAGGSKASIKLFRDLLKIRSSSYEHRREIQANKAADDARAAQQEATRAATQPARKMMAEKAARKAEEARALADIAGSQAAKLAAERAEAAAGIANEAAERRDED